jgi:hypothetical protein
MKNRIKIPMQDAKALLNLASKVREKHMADGDKSPLKVLNWEEIGPIIDDALATEVKALQLNREKLTTYQLRSSRLRAVLNIVRKSRDILTGVHDNDRIKELGHWGFDVIESRRQKSVQETVPPVTGS